MNDPLAWKLRTMHLRVYQADDVDDVAETEQLRVLLRPTLTLCEYAEHCLFPDKLIPTRDPRTIERLRDSLNWWRRLTGDPPLAHISDRNVTLFEELLRKQPGRRGEFMALETVRQTLLRVRSVMRRASRPHVVHGRRLTFMETVPDFEPPKKTKTVSKPYTLDELTRIIEAARHMNWPRTPGVPPAAWWRSLWRYLYYQGRRIGETLQLEYKFLQRDELTIPDRIAKHGHGATITLQEEALRAVEKIRTPRHFIFPLPRGKADRWTLDRQTEKLLKLAGVYLVGRMYHGARRSNADEAYLKGGQEAAQRAMDHKDPRTTDAYISDKARQLRDYEIKRQLPRLPEDPDDQLRLPFVD